MARGHDCDRRRGDNGASGALDVGGGIRNLTSIYSYLHTEHTLILIKPPLACARQVSLSKKNALCNCVKG